MAKRPTYGIIGVPTFGNVTIEWALNFHMLGVGLAVYVGYHYVRGKRVDIAKEEICERAVKDGADWVFLLDDDVIPPANTLIKMTKEAFGPPYLDVINGIYYAKSNPPIPLMFRGDLKGAHWNWHVGDLVEIDAAGAGCTFIKTEVLKKIEKEQGRPWFSVDYHYNPEDPNDFMPPSPGATEDLYFYKKVRKAGYKIWADTSIQCVHEDRSTNPPTYYALPDDYPQAIPGSDIKPRGKKLILDIGCGDTTPYFQEGVPVRLDFDEKNKPDILCDWNNIPEPDQKYDVVYASHALEHNPFGKVLNVLREWTRVLKVGGELRLIVPNLQYVAQKLVDDQPLDNMDMWTLYSKQKDRFDYHMAGFTPKLLEDALKALGTLEDIKVWTSDGAWSNWKKYPGKFNIIATAKKVKHHKAESIMDEALSNYSPEGSEKPYRKPEEILDSIRKQELAKDAPKVEEKPKEKVSKKKGK